MNTDGRALDHATLTELRKRGVAAVQSGESPPLVAAALGVNVRTLFRWLSLYRRGSALALLDGFAVIDDSAEKMLRDCGYRTRSANVSR
jgi:hypothetical protein